MKASHGLPVHSECNMEKEEKEEVSTIGRPSKVLVKRRNDDACTFLLNLICLVSGWGDMRYKEHTRTEVTRVEELKQQCDRLSHKKNKRKKRRKKRKERRKEKE